MSRRERDVWLRGLAPTPAQQYAVIVDLLRHANGDGMTREDRTICREERDRLLTLHGARITKHD